MTGPTTCPEATTRPACSPRERRSLIRQVLAEGEPGLCQFAINNACNAGCESCSFNLDALPRKDWALAPLAGCLGALQSERAGLNEVSS
jgi:hypothetical protein